MKLFEDFLDDINSEDIVTKQAPDYKDAYEFIAYMGSSVDVMNEDNAVEESEHYYNELQKSIRRLIKVLDTYSIDYYWDGKTYFNYPDLYEKLPDNLKEKYTLIDKNNRASISIYDADACAGFKILLGKFDSVAQFMYFMYYYCNLFNLDRQYSTRQIHHTKILKWLSFGYFGFFKKNKNGLVEMQPKHVEILAKEITEKGFLKETPDMDTLMQEIVEFMKKHKELNMSYLTI